MCRPQPIWGQLKDPWHGRSARLPTRAPGGSCKVFLFSACFEPPPTASVVGPVVLVCFSSQLTGARVQRYVTVLDLEGLRKGQETSQGRVGGRWAFSRREPAGPPACRWRAWNQKPASCSPPPAEPGWEQRHLHWTPPTCPRPLAEVQPHPQSSRKGSPCGWDLGRPAHGSGVLPTCA